MQTLTFEKNQIRQSIAKQLEKIQHVIVVNLQPQNECMTVKCETMQSVTEVKKYVLENANETMVFDAYQTFGKYMMVYFDYQ